MSKRSSFHQFLILCCTGLLFFLPSRVHAWPLAQTEEVTLTIINRSERSICDVRIASVTDDEWGENQLQEESIEPNESVSFPLDSGTYDIALVDCDENILLSKRLELSRDYDLIFTPQDLQRSECRKYNEQGVQLYGVGQYDEAIEAFQAASACYHEMDDRANEGATLSNIGFIYSAQGQYPEALEAFEAALVILREVDDHKGEGTTLNNIGGVYRAQGRNAEALELFETALAIAREVDDRNGEASALINIGGTYFAQGRAAAALEQFEAALVILREVDDREGEGTTLNNIGGIYHGQGRYSEALDQFKAALVIARELGDRRGEGIALSNIGEIYISQGQYTAALEQYEAAMVILREIGDPDGEATTLNNIGAMYDTRGDYPAALQHYEDALEIRRRIGDRNGEGVTLSNIGAVYAAQGQYAEALAQYEAALSIAREIDDRQSEAFSLNNIGGVYYTQGRYADALDIYDKVLVILRELGDRSSEGIALNNIGEVYVIQEKYEEALEQFEAALAIIQALGDGASERITRNYIGGTYAAQGQYAEAMEQYTAALAIAREIGDLQGEGIALAGIGSAYADMEQYNQALASYEQAMTAFDDVRATAGSDAGHPTFIAQSTDVYDQAIRLYIQQGQPAEAFRTSERGRARTFLDSLATRQLSLATKQVSIAPSQVELISNAAADMLTRYNEPYAMPQPTQDALARAKAFSPLDPELFADLASSRTNYVLELDTVQALLDNQTTLVSYWMLDEITVAFIVSHDNFTVVELPDATRDAIAGAVEDLKQWIAPDNPQPRPRTLRNLYDWLVAPLTDHLHTSQVTIVPHHLLHYVPFTALTDGINFFGQQYILSQLPSASVLPFLQQDVAQFQHVAEPKALVFGNPKTALPALPAAETEAVAVASFFHSEVYTGTAASERQLHMLINGIHILHLAAHGNYNALNPLYSAIALAVDDEAEYDGLLETHEIFALPLTGSNLVVLSACQTNMGELLPGDEVVGLTRAFFFAGTPAVVSSLWSVSDDATDVLMISFYHHWLEEGMSQAAALQAAQTDVRAHPKWDTPFFWAAFTFNGYSDSGISQ